MRQVTQNYKSGEIRLEEVDSPALRPGGILVRTHFSVVSTGTEGMKVREAKLSYLGKARARPDQLKKVMHAIRQQGLLATYHKVMNKLDTLTPLGYSLCGVVTEVGAGAEEFHVGQLVAAAGNEFALHAEYNWIPLNLCVPVPDGVAPEHAAFSTVGAIAMHGVRRSEVQLGDSAVVIRSLIRTQPGSQHNAAREFRRRMKNRFDRERIEIPYPQRKVHVTVDGEASAQTITAAGAAGG